MLSTILGSREISSEFNISHEIAAGLAGLDVHRSIIDSGDESMITFSKPSSDSSCDSLDKDDTRIRFITRIVYKKIVFREIQFQIYEYYYLFVLAFQSP